MQHVSSLIRSEPIRVEVNTVDATAWDDFAQGMDDVSLNQTSLYADSEWPGRTERFSVHAGNKAIGGAVVVLIRPPFIDRGLAYVKFGPMWRRRDMPASIETYRTVIAALTRHYCDDRRYHLTIRPRPNPDFMHDEMACLQKVGFRRFRGLSDANRYFVNASLTEAELLAGLRRRWRHELRRAMKNKLALERSNDQTGIDIFTDLNRQMVARKRIRPINGVKLLAGMRATLPEKIAPRIYIARDEGEPVAGIVVGLHGDVAYGLFGATSDEGKRLRAGYFLHWRIAVDLLSEPAVKWYDIGGEVQNEGLRYFKVGFVGETGVIADASSEFHYCNDGISHVAAKAIYGLRAAKNMLEHGIPH